MSLIYAALKEIERQEREGEPLQPLADAPALAPAWPWRKVARLGLALVLCVGAGAFVLRTGLPSAHLIPLVQAATPVPVPEPAPLPSAPALSVAAAPMPVAPQPVAQEMPVPAPELPVVAVTALLPPTPVPARVNLAVIPQDPPSDAVTPLSADQPSAGGLRLEVSADAGPAPTAAPPAAPARASREQRLQAARAAIQVHARDTPVTPPSADEGRIAATVAAFSAAMNRARLEEAEAHLLTLETLLPQQSLTRMRMRAWWLSAGQRQEEAAQLYQQILARRPADSSASVNLAMLQADLGRLSQARETLDRLSDNDPEYTRIEGYIRSREGQR